MKKDPYINFALIWAVFEVFLCLILLFILPEQIKFNFSIILTGNPTSGSKFYIFALPIFLFLTGGTKYWLDKNFPSDKLEQALLVINIVAVILTSICLIQLPFIN